MVMLDADRGRAGHIADERHTTGLDRSHLGPRGCRDVDAPMAGGETVIRALESPQHLLPAGGQGTNPAGGR